MKVTDRYLDSAEMLTRLEEAPMIENETAQASPITIPSAEKWRATGEVREKPEKRSIDSLPGWKLHETDPEVQEWVAEGRALVQAASVHQWAIADWMLRGEKTLGQRPAYDKAESITGYSRKTLTEWAYVARNLSIRMDNLSFGHHQAVAALLPEAQKRCLEQAAARGFSVSEVRQMARWQPRPLELSEIGRDEASLLLKFSSLDEFDSLEIAARQQGFHCDEFNSAAGRLIYELIREYIASHPELRRDTQSLFKALATPSIHWSSSADKVPA